jgi:DNA-directed RNA polymerase subunit N (RpoN/RPB10)
MIIPVRCYGCNKEIGNKYYFFKEEVARLKKQANLPDTDTILNINTDMVEKTIEGRVLDSIGCIRLCCRAHMMGHIEFM